MDFGEQCVVVEEIGNSKMPQQKRYFVVFCLLLLTTGCAGIKIDNATRQYHAVKSQVHIGQSKNYVLGILGPSQENLGSLGRTPDVFQNDGSTFEIHYMRSDRIPDGRNTDDEFTPYIFKDDKLAAIGWAALGGAQTHGSATANTAESLQMMQLGLQMMQGSSPSAGPNNYGSSYGSSTTCFKKTEWVSGLNKNCVYNCTGSDSTITIGAAQICPVTINR